MRMLSSEGPDAPMLADLARLFVVDGEGRPLVDEAREAELTRWLAQAVGVGLDKVDLRSKLLRWPEGRPGVMLEGRFAIGIKLRFSLQFVLALAVDGQDSWVGISSPHHHTLVDGVALYWQELAVVSPLALAALLARLNKPGRTGVPAAIALAQDGSCVLLVTRDAVFAKDGHTCEIGLRSPDGSYAWTSRKYVYREVGTRFEWAASANGPAIASYEARESPGMLHLWPEDGVRRTLGRLSVRPC